MDWNIVKLLYLLHALPVSIPNSFFCKLRSLQVQFVWAHKPPRIRHQLITRPKAAEGMGLPDFQKHYFATHLTRIIDWHCHSSSKDWVQPESDVTLINVQLPPWIPWSSCPAQLKSPHLIGITLQFFYKIAVPYESSSTPGPLTPLTGNTDFPPGIQITHGFPEHLRTNLW